jgi:hypothetical protein
MTAFQAVDSGSIPGARTKKKDPLRVFFRLRAPPHLFSKKTGGGIEKVACYFVT